MITVQNFYKALKENQVDFFTGVPDSLLKSICAYITDNTPSCRNIISANEGGAIALAAGYHLATNKIPLVYMQNSGIGNAINPLLSLADKEVYAIPMLILIGWRGEPGVMDEPQHVKQGRVTLSLLKTLEIPYHILDQNADYRSIIKDAVLEAKTLSSPFALIAKKDTFEPYQLINKIPDQYQLSRETAIELIVKNLPIDSVIISTTGMLSRELFEIREKNKQSHKSDFLTVGSMGHASQIALGIALAKPNRKVICFDGDGAAIMHAGSMGIIGSLKPNNFYHFIFNNSAHDSVGGQPTIGNQISFNGLAASFNYKGYCILEHLTDFNSNISEKINMDGPFLFEIKISKGARKDLGRPTSTPVENKKLFKSFLEK